MPALLLGNIVHTMLYRAWIVVVKFALIFHSVNLNFIGACRLRLTTLDMHKRKAIETAQTAADLKLHLDKYQAQLKEAQIIVTDKSSALQQQSYKYKRIQVQKYIYSIATELQVQENTGKYIYSIATELQVQENTGKYIYSITTELQVQEKTGKYIYSITTELQVQEKTGKYIYSIATELQVQEKTGKYIYSIATATSTREYG